MGVEEKKAPRRSYFSSSRSSSSSSSPPPRTLPLPNTTSPSAAEAATSLFGRLARRKTFWLLLGLTLFIVYQQDTLSWSERATAGVVHVSGDSHALAACSLGSAADCAALGSGTADATTEPLSSAERKKNKDKDKKPLTSLGFAADDAFHLGSTDLDEYTLELDRFFRKTVLPASLDSTPLLRTLGLKEAELEGVMAEQALSDKDSLYSAFRSFFPVLPKRKKAASFALAQAVGVVAGSTDKALSSAAGIVEEGMEMGKGVVGGLKNAAGQAKATADKARWKLFSALFGKESDEARQAASVAAASAADAAAAAGASSSTSNDDDDDADEDEVQALLESSPFVTNANPPAPLTTPVAISKKIFQTAADKEDTELSNSWREENKGYKYTFLNDDSALQWVKKTFAGEIERTYVGLPKNVMRSDLLRYLVLLAEGGTYSDMDTQALKPIDTWLSHATDLDKVDGIAVNASIPPTLIVGIEADVGERADWHEWWPRPLQLVQWTMSASRAHPVLVDAVRRLVNASRTVDKWRTDIEIQAKELEVLSKEVGLLSLREQRALARELGLDVAGGALATAVEDSTSPASTKTKGTETAGGDADSHAKANTNVVAPMRPSTAHLTTLLLNKAAFLRRIDPTDDRHGGPLSIMEWSGPGIFSDSVLRYLKARYDVDWDQLRGLTKPKRIGEVVILPITGFSPGVGQMGAEGVDADLAFVQHRFAGSWKTSPRWKSS